MGIALVFVMAIIVSAAVVGWVRQQSLRTNTLDMPNERSSHTIPTPRGGGLGIVVAFSLGLVALVLLGAIEVPLALGIGGTGLIAAFVGYLDDRSHVPPMQRLIAHVLAAVWLLVWLGGMPVLDLGFAVIEWGVIGHLVGAIGTIWLLNLYNFMDGIDGLAASEGVFVGLAGGLVLLMWQVADVALIAVLLAAACLGFLVWNWPPAKIFMGDVGSGFLGVVIAGLAISSSHQQPLSAWMWLILVGVFFVDATVTLLRRLARGEKVYEAHRSHAYQRMTIRLQQHRPVTIGIILLNVLWLFPWALWVYWLPTTTLLAVVMSLVGLAVLAWRLGAGQPST